MGCIYPRPVGIWLKKNDTYIFLFAALVLEILLCMLMYMEKNPLSIIIFLDFTSYFIKSTYVNSVEKSVFPKLPISAYILNASNSTLF